MSRLFDAIRRMETERHPPTQAAPKPAKPIEFLAVALTDEAKAEQLDAPEIVGAPTLQLVALSDRHGLGAEKFRALATRIENLRRQRELKSLQITSSSAGEGKTLVAGNLAATLAIQTSARVLLIGGDLHRPALGQLFGISPSEGLSHWWAQSDREITHYIHKLKDLSLWILSEGQACEEPSHILQSSRLAAAFGRLQSEFDWIIVDSAPMLPTVTANLWSRLVDGTLLVVREGVARVKDLKNGLEALDSPKLIGIVMNDSSDASRSNYRYYADPTNQVVKTGQP